MRRSAVPDFIEFFDVKFYPYNPVGASPVFAAVSKKHVSLLADTHVMLSSLISSQYLPRLLYAASRK